jgi:Flp pilus assembly protein TadG
MRRGKNSEWKRKGIAIILTALMLTIVVPMVGLAIDAGMMFAIRAKMQAAADAASMASARALAKGLTIEEQEASAMARAEAYFDANFPPGAMYTGASRSIEVEIDETAYRTRRVLTRINISPPSYFMRYFVGGGYGSAPPLNVKVVGQTSRRDVNVMLVVDRSGSLQTAGACDDVEIATLKFVDQFANQRDALGLLTFGGSYRVDFAMSQNFLDSTTGIKTALSKLYPGGCNDWTGSAQAYWQGYQQLLARNEPGVLNVLLFFTDGQPNTLTAEWPVKTILADGYKSRCFDWANNKYYYDTGWNPVNQKYRGYIAGDGSRDGVRGHLANPIPTGDPGKISLPVGYETQTPKSVSNDCYFRNSGSQVDRDIAYYPDEDFYGNSVYGHKSISTFSVGHPYAGKVKITSLTTQKNAAINAVADAALRVRANLDYKVVTYALGLGGVGAAEHDLLLRVSNDKDSPAYDSTALEGLYVYAPDPSQLNDAFVKIASEILRYNK